MTAVEHTFLDRLANRESVLERLVKEIVTQIHRKTGEPVDVVLVRDLVEADWDRYDDARVRTFLPVLVCRAVLDQLLGA